MSSHLDSIYISFSYNTNSIGIPSVIEDIMIGYDWYDASILVTVDSECIDSFNLLPGAPF